MCLCVWGLEGGLLSRDVKNERMFRMFRMYSPLWRSEEEEEGVERKIERGERGRWRVERERWRE